MVATNGDGKGTMIVNGYCDLFPVYVCDCVFRQFCTSLQTDNLASTPPLSFYRPDAPPAAQPTAS